MVYKIAGWVETSADPDQTSDVTSCPILILIYALGENTGKKSLYNHKHFGNILYRHILKTTTDFSMTFSAFIWNMIFSG